MDDTIKATKLNYRKLRNYFGIGFGVGIGVSTFLTLAISILLNKVRDEVFN